MKENRLVITFPTTTAAMNCERVCNSEGLPGRLIPVPPQLKAGCGLAWLTVPAYREKFIQLAEEFALVYDLVVEQAGLARKGIN